MQIAIIVNDMADVNVDGAVLAGSAEFRAAEPRLVELSSGCVCCTLRADLIDVRSLAHVFFSPVAPLTPAERYNYPFPILRTQFFGILDACAATSILLAHRDY